MDSLKVMILGVNRYSFEDQKTGREVQGTTVHYVQLTHTDEADKIGLFPTKATLSYNDFDQFRGLAFPVQAEARIQLDMTQKNPIKVKGFLLGDHVLIN